MTQVRTTCPYCGVGCGVLATAQAVQGDPDHPANRGRLCSKGSALAETTDLDGRLLHPVINGEPADWDRALDLVASEFSRAIAEHGPDSVAFYVSGQLLTEDYYVANKLMKGFIGSANIDTNSRLCMASSVAGHKRAFGSDTVPGQYEDFEQADVITLVGSNLAWCHPVLYQRIVAAKKLNPALKVINIDPRRTATSDLADIHLSIRPDGDAALFNAVLARIADRGAVNTAYVAAHISGFDAALQAAHASNPVDSGLSRAEIDAFCDLWIGAEKVVTIYSQGVNQSVCGTDKVNAIINCHLATGRIGKPGMGPFSVTGQPNAMGGREVGGLANMLACHLDIENAEHRDAVQTAWRAPTMATQSGLKAVDLFQACASGKIKALWVISTNPAVSMPDADAVARAISNVPFTVVSDVMARTDTGDLAHVLLPAAAWGEKSGTVTNSERCISRQRPFMAMPDGTRADWQIICDVAARMGWKEAFDYTSPAQIFREYAALSGVAASLGRDFDISGLSDLTDAAYDGLRPTVWPVPKTGPHGGRFFADGGFYHADGRARMLPIVPPAVQEQVEFPYRLNSGRVRDHWHTMTRTGKSARLSQHIAEPFVEMHPEDALANGLHDAELAELTSPSGRGVFRVLITTRAQKGNVFVPMHWTRAIAPAGLSNAMVAPVVDPVSGQPALKGGFVAMSRFKVAWYGFAASIALMEPTRPFAAIAKTKTGWQAEVAGCKLPKDWEAEARTVLNLSGGAASVLTDPVRGTARVAIHDGSVLQGVFFASASPTAVARSHAVSLIGTSADALSALAGRPGVDQPDCGAVVCSCFNVGVNTLRTAISKGASDLDSIGKSLNAGTNCGSCRPEIQALISAALQQVAAE